MRWSRSRTRGHSRCAGARCGAGCESIPRACAPSASSSRGSSAASRTRGRCLLSAEPVRGLGVRLLGEGEHLGRLDPEHRGGVLARAEDAVADVEVPDAAVLRLVGVGEPLQLVAVFDPDGDALDDDIEALRPGVVAGRHGHLRAVLEVARLLLAQARAEVHRFALHDADQRRHVRAAVAPAAGSLKRRSISLFIVGRHLGSMPLTTPRPARTHRNRLEQCPAMTRMSDHPLRRAIAGEVLVPGAAGYEAVRKPAIARYHDVRPRAIVRCENAGDVAETLAFARRSGLPVAPRSGGHCFAGRSSTEGIVIDVGPMSSVSVSGGVATVGAGTRLGNLYDALQEHGLTVAAGCGPAVGIAGLTLGGGLGILGRKHGLTCDQLLAAQVVLADGRVVDCDEHHDADLFWALRGAGGGQFGLVTSLVFRTLTALPATTFHLVWPYTHAAAVIGAWQDWAPDAPDELNASLRLTSEVNLFGAMLGGESETVVLLEQLTAQIGAVPESATCRQLPYRAAKNSLSGSGRSRTRTTRGCWRTSPSSSAARCRRMRSRRWCEGSPTDAGRASRAS